MTRDNSIDAMVAALRDSVSQPADGGVATEQQILAKVQTAPVLATHASTLSTVGASLCAVAAAWLALQWALPKQSRVSDHPQEGAEASVQQAPLATPASPLSSSEQVGSARVIERSDAEELPPTTSEPSLKSAPIASEASQQKSTPAVGAREAAAQRRIRRESQAKPTQQSMTQGVATRAMAPEPPHQNSGAHPTPTAAPPLPETSARVTLSAEQARMQFRAAHRMQFSATPDQALKAWDRFLAQAPKGILRIEAEFNRAIVLARLGRSKEAAAALEPFAKGIYGKQRMAQAQRLLGKLAH